MVFYEAPHRIADTLSDAAEVFGAEREAVLARELTKTFETIKRLPLGLLHQWVKSDPDQQRGEQVLLIEPAGSGEVGFDDATRRLLERLAAELPPRKAAAIAADRAGLTARDLYNYLLARR